MIYFLPFLTANRLYLVGKQLLSKQKKKIYFRKPIIVQVKKVLEVKILTPQQKCKKGDLEFHRSVIPIQTRGADYAPHATASPPGFK